jgi:O-antigen/teichoic acid export membrane protein
MFRRTSRNTLILLVNSLGTGALAFLLTVLISQALGKAELGRYAAVMAWIFPLTLLADFGVNTYITREVAASSGQGLFRAGLHLRWFIGGGLMLLVWLGAPWLSKDPVIVQGLRIAAPMILIDSLFGLYTAIWRGKEIMWPLPLLNGFYVGVQVIGAAFVIWRDFDIRGVLAAIVAADVLQLAAAWLLNRRIAGVAVPQTILSPWILARQAWPFAIAGILAAVQGRFLIILLETYQSPEAVGLFAASGRFIEVARLPAFAFFGALFPAVSSGARDFRGARLGVFLYALGCAILFSLFGGFLLRNLLGEEFGEAAPILTLLSWALVPALVRQTIFVYMYAGGLEARANRFLAVLMILQVIFGLLLIPNSSNGAQGAALATLAAEWILLPILWFTQNPVVSGRR